MIPAEVKLAAEIAAKAGKISVARLIELADELVDRYGSAEAALAALKDGRAEIERSGRQ